MKQTGLFLFLTGARQQMVQRSYFIKITSLISHSVYNLHMARGAPHLTDFQHAVQVKMRAACFHGILFLQSLSQHLGLLFATLQQWFSASSTDLSRAEPAWGQPQSCLCVCLSSPDISLALDLLLPKSATGGTRDGAPHVSGTSTRNAENASDLQLPQGFLKVMSCCFDFSQRRYFQHCSIHHSFYNIQINQRRTLNIWEFI